VTYYTTIVFRAQKISGTCRADGLETLAVRYFTQQECAQLVFPLTTAFATAQFHQTRLRGISGWEKDATFEAKERTSFGVSDLARLQMPPSGRFAMSWATS
jgi:hypothetical protein